MASKFFRLQRIKQQLRRFLAIPFILFSLGLFVFSVTSSSPLSLEIKSISSSVFAPIVERMAVPFKYIGNVFSSLSNYLDVYDENDRLRQENQQLKGWQAKALSLLIEQKELQSMLNYKPIQEKEGIVVPILSEYNSSFSHSIILKGGKDKGIKKGDVLISNNSLFGHIVEVNEHYSKALKLTDYFSRLPVFVGENKELGMMMGDNTKFPELSAFKEEVVLKEGDFVMTAGLAGVYPQGIGIGIVKKDADTFKVQLFESETNPSFVRVIDFSLGGLIDVYDDKGDK